MPLSGGLRKVHPQTGTLIVALLVGPGLTIAFVLWGNSAPTRSWSYSSPLPRSLRDLLLHADRLLVPAARLPAPPNAFSLGRWRTAVVIAAFVRVVFVLACLMVPSGLHQANNVMVGAPAFAFIW